MGHKLFCVLENAQCLPLIMLVSNVHHVVAHGVLDEHKVTRGLTKVLLSFLPVSPVLGVYFTNRFFNSFDNGVPFLSVIRDAEFLGKSSQGSFQCAHTMKYRRSP